MFFLSHLTFLLGKINVDKMYENKLKKNAETKVVEIINEKYWF